MRLFRVKKVSLVGRKKSVDFKVSHRDHNFYANNLVTSNSHAYSYTKLTALTVYLKWKYPTLFFLEAIKKAHKDQKTQEAMNEILPELRYFGIKLLPPDLIKSSMDFTIEGNDIRYGLQSIKHVKSLGQLTSFIDTEKSNKFHVFQAAKLAKMNISTLVSLIQTGCLSSFNNDRPAMVLEAQIWSKLSDREKNYCITNGAKYKYDLVAALQDYLNWNDGKVFKESRLNTIRRDTTPYISLYRQNRKYPELTAFMYERALLRYSYSYNLRQIFSKSRKELKSCDEILNEVDNHNECNIVGIIEESKFGVSKAGNDCLRMVLSDETGMITVIMTGDKVNRFLASSKVPEPGEIIYVEGQKGNDCIFMNFGVIEDFKIYFRPSEIKEGEEDE